ncbi:MAG: saccharopine dehydrogenase C-terminal domain-containing protein [Candidatus Thermoplasmatota archaeon]
MKVLILGAGKIGSAIAFDLMKNKAEVGIADVDFGNAKKVARKYNATAIKVNVKAYEKLIKLMKKYDTIVSAVPYFFNYKLAKAAIGARVNFCDLGGNTEIVEKELKLHDKAKSAGVTIIPDCGLAPGITNILSNLGARKVKNPYAIYCRVGGLPQKPTTPLNYGLFFSVEGLINEYTGKCRIIRNGKIKEVEPLTEIEPIKFPGFKNLECFHTSGGSSTLPETFKNKVKELNYKTIRYAGHSDKIKTMIDLGLASEKLIKIGRSKIKPRDVLNYILKKNLKPCKDVVLLRVSVVGEREKKEYELMDYFDEKSKLTAMARTTGFSTSIIAQYLANGEIGKGAFPPEICVPAEKFIADLAKRGITVNENFRYS